MFYPFEEKPKKIEDTLMPFTDMYPVPYNKHEVDPYTRIRIILMNGIEVESILFSHQFHRNCPDNELRRELAMMRRIEQQQQKHINWLKPIDESQIETTIGYEHVAVDLTAWLAQNEPDPYVKSLLDFALLEDFDHLYRYSNLLDLDKNIPAQQLTKSYVEITPARPTVAHHRHPDECVKYHLDFKKAAMQTKLNSLIIVAGEQQTMNFYMNLGNTYQNDIGRKLYQEIAMVEEQHVSHYGSLLDPNATWLENLLLHQYMEVYLYYSFYEDELDPHVKGIWERHLHQELSHLHKAKELLEKYEKKDWQSVVEPTFPTLLQFHDTREYVRKVLAEQVHLQADKEGFAPIDTLPDDHGFFKYQDIVHSSDAANDESHDVIARHIERHKQDYRDEVSPNPVEALQNRTVDNINLARQKS